MRPRSVSTSSVGLLVTLVTLGATAAGCDDHDHAPEPYATFQLCYDDHHTVEALPVQQAIVVCCLEHEIAGTAAPVCGDAAAACEAYLGTNLDAASATPTEVTAACAEYITQKGM
ncbi:MAG: hypothetical protein R3B06_12355 [Kofleriaceae bacterium]